ncbi:GNAT family N-acetyltransferase [Scleromatobacter humisilvae]|uniref:GNAT family N-acetyltransferase n=1 Tax=Scleromatobacter humisilvae TaxID=2897159 RepID=A0A9X2C4A4_9BURK|nr:GNAT family N-acetyltransferase [Scleromatobacter humisilvae]MCK9689719.1 GNAT family N-acetyltransferase [Scleromatobacter humisilvae]
MARTPLGLRDATLADLATIDEIHVQSRRVAYRGQVSDHYLDVTMPAASIEDWRRKLPALLDGAGRVLVAESDGEPIAFVAAFAPDERGSVYINNLHARPDRKGLGAGSALLAATAQWARDVGASALHLKVLQTNTPAIGFYESLGWRCVDRVDDTWAGEAIVALVYAIDLT